MESKRDAVSAVESITAEDDGANCPIRTLPTAMQRANGVEAARSMPAPSTIESVKAEEVIVTGARASRARQTPHKGVAAPVGNGSSGRVQTLIMPGVAAANGIGSGGDCVRTFAAGCRRRPRQVPAVRREPREAGRRRAGVHILGGRRIPPRTASFAGS
jgi:hypothetical protein